MKEAATGICGKTFCFSKNRDEWWDDEVQDAVKKKESMAAL